MSRFFVSALLVLSLLSSSNLFAQEDETSSPSAEERSDGERERGRNRGRGGRFGNQAMGFIPLLQVDSVKQEIKLEGDQAAQVETLTVKIREDFAEEVRELMQSLREADRMDREQFREKLSAIADRVNERLGTVLDSEQTSRLRQINLQLGMRRNGAAEVLSSADIATALDLTAEQQEQLRDKAREVRRNRGPEARTLSEAREEASKVLTSEQQEKLTNLLGAEFDLPAALLERGRGRSGRRGDGEGRRPLRQRPEAQETAPSDAI